MQRQIFEPKKVNNRDAHELLKVLREDLEAALDRTEDFNAKAKSVVKYADMINRVCNLLQDEYEDRFYL